MKGYCGCEFCEAIGQYVDKRVIYPDMYAPQRIAENWEKYLDVDKLYQNAPPQTKYWQDDDVEEEYGHGHVISLDSPFYSEECREILNVDMVRIYTIYCIL